MLNIEYNKSTNKVKEITQVIFALLVLLMFFAMGDGNPSCDNALPFSSLLCYTDSYQSMIRTGTESQRNLPDRKTRKRKPGGAADET
jgi:hypothetical protein